MIAFQVAGKATRDALFLSNFPLESLPAVVAASAGVAIVAVFGASRLLSTKGPGVVIPYAFGASAVLLLAEWLFYGFSPRTTAVVFYLHMAGFGAILVSGFWSIVSELFDPRTAKAQIGRIAGAGTLGGLIGGVIAERIGTGFSINAMLPVLAALHLFCALLNRRLRMPIVPLSSRPASGEAGAMVKSGIAVLRSETYLKRLALLVMLGTIGETLLDYVLKRSSGGDVQPKPAVDSVLRRFLYGNESRHFPGSGSIQPIFFEAIRRRQDNIDNASPGSGRRIGLIDLAGSTLREPASGIPVCPEKFSVSIRL